MKEKDMIEEAIDEQIKEMGGFTPKTLLALSVLAVISLSVVVLIVLTILRMFI